MLRYYSYNNFLKDIFNCRVYKVSIDAGFSCPNRDGTKGLHGCIYCDERGSSSRTHEINTPIKTQILKNISIRKSRYRAEKFIAYFQSYTNTYSSKERLKEIYDEAIFSHPDISGLSISTRPDCIDEEKLKLIASYREFLPYVCIEYGMQSSHNKSLELLNRCEKHEDFLHAINLTKKFNLDICAHVILGLPNETKEDMLKTADVLASLKVQGIKLHLLIAIKNTPLEKMYENNKWHPLDFDEYVQIASDFIERLPPTCVIHRTSGSGHPLDLIAPKWIYEKKYLVMQSINQELEKRNSFQGFFYNNPKRS
jgi:uncharacterized protein